MAGISHTVSLLSGVLPSLLKLRRNQSHSAAGKGQGLWIGGKMCVPSTLYLHPAITDPVQASADRRPVDPPPVVELKIFEGERDNRTDVTFSHNANFFLFTTLENARPMAKGRLPVAPSTFPVLTGSPVAGMAYLDRPNPAGYFIFPDLSVRHEGLYRLSFSLFEELKEDKDADVEPPGGSPKSKDKLLSSNPMAPRAHVHFRLEVKSVPFAVYSAKKFPGLSESTPLSRTVAEQGCRVRIRRDVRMRRRDKNNEGYQEYEDENSYTQSEHYQTPHQASDRPRSISNGSMDPQTPYSTGRRQSMPDPAGGGYFPPIPYTHSNYQQPPPPPAPAPVQSATSFTSHLNFGGSTTPQYATPTFPLSQQPPAPHSYNQNSPNFQYPTSYHARQMSAPNNYNYHAPPPPQLPSYAHSPIYPDSTDYRPVVDNRRASAGMPLNHQSLPPHTMSTYVNNHPVLQQAYCAQQQQPGSRTPTPINTLNGYGPPPTSLPPLKMDHSYQQGAVEPKYEPQSPLSSIQRQIMPSVASSTYASYATNHPPGADTSARSGKRGYGKVFSESHMDQPLHSGMRPGSADQGRDREQIETDTGELEDIYSDIAMMRSQNLLVYKRADGSHQTKKCPSPIDPSGFVVYSLESTETCTDLS